MKGVRADGRVFCDYPDQHIYRTDVDIQAIHSAPVCSLVDPGGAHTLHQSRTEAVLLAASFSARMDEEQGRRN